VEIPPRRYEKEIVIIYLSEKYFEIAIVLEETRAQVQRNSVLVENTNGLTPTGKGNNPCRRTTWIVEKSNQPTKFGGFRLVSVTQNHIGIRRA
jgi:ethanolamine utilization cobalamin adenosyltransferase